MNHLRSFGTIVVASILLGSGSSLFSADTQLAKTLPFSNGFKETSQGRDWLQRWEKSIIQDSASRYCDKEMGEGLGWMVSPFLNGYYYGYLTTHDSQWVDRFIDWSDSAIRRGIQEPDGFVGWPKGDGGGFDSKDYDADSLLGEAMMFRPIVLMSAAIQKDPGLNAKYGAKARSYIELAEKVFQKFDSRGCWRDVKEGGVWIVAPFGIDKVSGGWSSGYTDRKNNGFTNPDNKQNHIAMWLLALHDVTKKPIYRDRAEKWFRVMKSRMKTRDNGKYYVWDYWDPAGTWDYNPDGRPKHWVGVHPNGGYYSIDSQAIVASFAHGIVFTKADIDKLIATNRDFMWNQKLDGAKFRRIDGEEPDSRWKGSPGLLWDALVPYDQTLRKIFVANHHPAGWGGLSLTPWFLAGGDSN